MAEIVKEAKIDLEPGTVLFGSVFGSLLGRVILELRSDGTVTWRDIEPRTVAKPPVV